MRSPNEEDPRILFRKVAEQASCWGISGNRLAQLSSVQVILAATASTNELNPSICRRRRQTTLMIIAGLVILFATVVALILRYELYTSRGFTDFWFTWKRRDFDSERCTIDMPNTVQDIFRPPVSCSVCQDVDKVDVVSSITPTEFQNKYAYSGRPVVIADATGNWSAMNTFSFEFFRMLYGEQSSVLENFRQSCQFFPYKTEFHSLRDVFQMTLERSQLRDGTQPWYIGWSNCDSTAANVLRRYYARPYFLPTDAESSKTDWIFMGSPGYGAHMHIDHVGNPSWQAQISGQKKWTLVPPPECEHLCRPLEIIVEPGQIIVLDTNAWFHQTLIVGNEMSITIGSEYD